MTSITMYLPGKYEDDSVDKAQCYLPIAYTEGAASSCERGYFGYPMNKTYRVILENTYDLSIKGRD